MMTAYSTVSPSRAGGKADGASCRPGGIAARGRGWFGQAVGLMLLALLLHGTAGAQGLERQPAPEDAEVYFISPTDGETVSSPVRVHFGLSGMGVAPAGIKFDHTGHHHLLINIDEDEMPPMDRPLPATDQIVHFGGGETETTIDLPPGEHRLQLVLGDYLHMPHEPPVVSAVITITVMDDDE